MANAPGAQRIEMPPSSVSGELYGWLTRAALALNNIPSLSYTSYATPESNVTGAPGSMLINLASDSSTTRAWIKQAGTGNTGWVSLASPGGGSGGAVTSVNSRTGAVTLTKSDVGLGSVENTALSTWAGSANLTTLGTIGTGVWHGTAIDHAYLSGITAADVAAGTFPGASYSFGSSAVSMGALTATSLQTAAPTGGTAGVWKAGIYVASAPAATGYVQLDIGGTLYKLLAST